MNTGTIGMMADADATTEAETIDDQRQDSNEAIAHVQFYH